MDKKNQTKQIIIIIMEKKNENQNRNEATKYARYAAQVVILFS